jgi:ribosome biogenesis GTPase
LRPTQIEREDQTADLPLDERMSGKGELTRHRTLMTDLAEESAGGREQRSAHRALDEAACLRGRVISPRGFGCLVQGEDGKRYDCAVRRLLKTVSHDDRTVTIAGDRVLFRRDGDNQGVIERVEPRHGTLSRQIRGQKQVLVANVDQVLIVGSADDPPLKPALIDRYLISAQLGGIRPIVCINKADLADPVELQPLVGIYSQLGYEVLLTSTQTGLGIARLKHLLRNRESALTGQSGVGKSSLLNAVDPPLNLRTLEVSSESGKGRHTTTNANLLELSFGGWVVDTPGIRQLELWDVIAEEVEGYFGEFRPFVMRCKYPDCSHTHESGCHVKRAVALGMISEQRYDSYYRIRMGDWN